MSDLNIDRAFDFHAALEGAVVTVAVDARTVTLTRGAEVETYTGSFELDQGILSGSVTAIAHTTSGQPQWELAVGTAAGEAGSFDAGVLQGLALAPGGTQAYYGYLLQYDDTVHARGTGAVLDGYGGTNTLSYDLARSAVTASLLDGTATTSAGTDELHHFANLSGSKFADTLTGNAGDNVLDGGAGADELHGGAGDDTYIVDNAGDRVAENSDPLVKDGAGDDTVRSSVTITAPEGIEHIVLTGTANIDASDFAGGDETYPGITMTGNAGNNTLNATASSIDTLNGGDGDDLYLLGGVHDFGGGPAQLDHVVEAAGAGYDTVRVADTYTLTANVEALQLAFNDAFRVDGYGNALDNRITGSSTGNTLDGRAGSDTLAGLAGDDVYVVDNVGDRVIEAADAGYDAVRASVSFVLGRNVEELTLTGRAAIDGTGNALANTITGNEGDNKLDGGAGVDVLSGGAGDDTYVLDTARDTITGETSGHDTVIASFSAALATDIEDLELAGTRDLRGTGNDLDNVLTGNRGDNTLNGRAGSDLMRGGDGDDTYVIDATGDRVLETQSSGHDTVQASIDYRLGSNVEDLVLTGRADIDATGNSAGNAITGNRGDNVIDGGRGADQMSGGRGDDHYVVDRSGDTVIETVDAGYDTVSSRVTLTLGDNVEALILGETRAALDGTGNALDNDLTGNAFANHLDGSAGDDVMRGLGGNDVYTVDSSADRVIEAAGGGNDRVFSTVSYALGDEVEILTLAGTDSIDGTGNAQDNELDGNRGDNVLDGGAGADSMNGWLGNDTYVVDNRGDKIVESWAGRDTVLSSISYTLGYKLENLTLTGTANLHGEGNADRNILIGNSGDNLLDGGAGADRMAGGAGDDRYLVDDAKDVVVEAAGDGTDTVVSSVASLRLAANVENLHLSTADGTLAKFGFGNALDNTIEGNALDNLLDGDAGIDTISYAHANVAIVDLSTGIATGDGGTDTLRGFENIIGSIGDDRLAGDDGANRLTGGRGSDEFVLNSVLATDTVTDFRRGVDRLAIDQQQLHVGDGDGFIEHAIRVAGAGGFAADAELVIVTHDTDGSLGRSAAAGAIGSAQSAYAVGDTALFVVDNGEDSAVYLFTAANADAVVSAGELTRLAVLNGAVDTFVSDYLFHA